MKRKTLLSSLVSASVALDVEFSGPSYRVECDTIAMLHACLAIRKDLTKEICQQLTRVERIRDVERRKRKH